jgi:hypothetical protein
LISNDARPQTGARDQLDLEVELIAVLMNPPHPKTLKTDKTANFLVHPLFSLAPRS